MNRSQLIEWVIAKMDEVMPTGTNAVGETVIDAPINFIDGELDNSVRYVLQTAPDDMVMGAVKLGGKHDQNGIVDSRLVIKEDLSCIYVLPTDFLRHIDIKLASWSRSVAVLMDYKDPRYAHQQARYRRGTPRKPMAVLRPFKSYLENEIIAGEPNVNYCLELFSAADTNDTVEDYLYIPLLNVEQLPDNLLDPVAWVCASRAFQIMKRSKEAQEAMQRAEMQLNIKIGK